MIVCFTGCTKNEFTISYDLDGGQCENLIYSFFENENLNLPTPVKDGYDFIGWYEEDKKIEKIENKNYHLIAKWTKKVYTFETITLQVKNGNYYVMAELLIPYSDSLVPSVVIVPGSGPSDLDGTVQIQKPYKVLTEKLAENGIASIRFNKVTFQYPAELTNEFDFSIEDEYLYAVSRCIDILKENEKISDDKIFLIGHSLGSQIIPILLHEDSTLVGGIIMGGTTMHILDLLLEQVKQQSVDKYEEFLPSCNYVKSLTNVPAGEEQYFYFGAYTAYYVSYNKINRDLIKDLNCPMLIMQGDLDLQVSKSHFNNYKSLLKDKSNVVYKNYPKLNHLFSYGVGETISNAYKINNIIPTEVFDDIYNFINNNINN